jgi:hypothetical protein
MRRWSTRTRRVTFLPPPPLPSLPTSFAPSPAVQHIVNNSHTFSPLPPSRATETRGKYAALQRCGSRDIDANYWGACLLLRLRMRCGGRRCGARRQRQRAATAPRLRPCHACRWLQTRYLRFWRHELHLQFSRASGANGLQRLRGWTPRAQG